ncbi:MAG TPA: hypothetical protein VK801_19020 [Caulobacteraceae bacterium]|nr:hypothetical protein [Caulobacteraceae bacterium]
MLDDAATAEAPDPAILRAEWRLRMIEELAEIGMDLARGLHHQALAAADPAEPAAADTPETPTTSSARRAAVPGDDPAETFARLSRAVRLSLALHARTDEALRALRAGAAAEVEARRAQARKQAADEDEARSKSHRDTVERLVIEAAEREVEDDESLGAVIDALEERLEQDEAYWDLDQMPLREAVERLCADLELTPDWSRWEGEGWPPKPPFSRFRFSPWSRPSRTPLGDLDDGAPQIGGVLAHRRE